MLLPYLSSAHCWEPTEVALLRTLFSLTTRFLDVGANVGYFSALAAQCSKFGTIDAVEPDPANVALLRLNLWALAPSATVWPVCLGDSRKVVPFTRNMVNCGDGRVGLGARAGTLAAMARGDELFEGRSFDVIKLDVQGYESDVLSGLQQVLKRSSNVRVVLEFFPEAIARRSLDPKDVLKFYSSLGMDRLVELRGKLCRLEDEEILALCAKAGPNGSVNLLLRNGA